MAKNRIKAYWLLLLTLLYTMSLVLSVGETQARYINTAEWDTVMEQTEEQVRSDLLQSVDGPPVTVLLGELVTTAYSVEFTLNSGVEAKGALSWSVSPKDYLEVEMSIDDEVLSQDEEVELYPYLEQDDVLSYRRIVTMTLNPIAENLTEAVPVTIEVTWGKTLRGTFLITLPAVGGALADPPEEETEPPTEPDETVPEPTETEPTEPDETVSDSTETEPTEPDETVSDSTETEATEPDETVSDSTETEATEPDETVSDSTETEPTEPDETVPDSNETQTEPDPASETDPTEQTPEPSTGDAEITLKVTQLVPHLTYTSGGQSEESQPETSEGNTQEDVSVITEEDTEENSDQTQGDASEENAEETPGADDETNAEDTVTEDGNQPSGEAEETEPEPTAPLELQLETQESFELGTQLPLQLLVPEKATMVRLGMGVQNPITDGSQGSSDLVMSQFPQFLCYSLDGGESYYMLYTPDIIVLKPGETAELPVLLDWSRTKLTQTELIVLADCYDDQNLISMEAAPVTVERTEVPCVKISSRFLTKDQPITILIPEAWREYTLEYTVELLTCGQQADAESEELIYVELTDPETSGITATLDESTGTLTLSMGEKLPQAGSYRVHMKWMTDEETCEQEAQETFFINYLTIDETIDTGGAEQ